MPIALGTIKVAEVPRPGADFQISEREIPKPGAGEVRIKIKDLRRGCWKGCVGSQPEMERGRSPLI
jgi:hypothetical protein